MKVVNVVPMHITDLRAVVTLDAENSQAYVDATMTYVVGPADGSPFFDLRQQVERCWIDGIAMDPTAIAGHDIGEPARHSSVRVIRPRQRAKSVHAAALGWHVSHGEGHHAFRSARWADSASAEVKGNTMASVSMTSADDEQPLLRLIQEGSTGAAASIRIDDPNPDIEFVETGLSLPDSEAGKFEIAVQADRLQINGRRAAGSPVKGFDVIVEFQRPAAGGNIGFGFRRNIDYGDFGGGRGAIVIANAAAAPTHNVAGAGILFVENGALKFRGSNGTVTQIAPA